MHFIRGKYSWVCLLSVMLASSGVLGTSAQAQSVEAEKEGLPLKPERKIEFTTDEGTWMSLDVSRDGKTILFELLGDLYTVPIAGGDAVGITSGMAFDSQARYSPDGEYITFVSDRGGSENVWIANVDGTDPKLQRFIPHDILDSLTKRRRWYRQEEYFYPKAAAAAAKIVRAGGRVCIGGHGEFQGISVHWDMWALSSGMTNYEVLRAATLHGAEAIGHAQDLGSIEVGKLADLIVLTGNPLDDIRKTYAIKYVMKNGELFNGDTLDQIWPQQKTLQRMWWWDEKP